MMTEQRMTEKEFAFYTHLLKRQSTLKDKPFFDLDKKRENHHFIGRINADKTYCIHKNRHDFISTRTNFLPRALRQQPSIAFLTNAIGGFELMAFELQHVLHRVKEAPSWQNLEDELLLRELSIEEITFCLINIMEQLHNEERDHINQNIHKKKR